MVWGLGLCLLAGFLQGCASGKLAGEAAPSLAEATPGAGRPDSPPQPVAMPPASAGKSAARKGAPAAPRAKAISVRAYARDGASFYQNGRLIRIQGLEVANGGEHARQRLQQLLDRGQVSVSPVGEAGGGALVAVVRVNGRDVAQLAN